MSTLDTTDLAADVARTQRQLDTLHGEQRDLPRQIADASRGDDPALWARLALRQANLAHEITAAGGDALRARLALAWDDAERLTPLADDAQQVLAHAQADLNAHEQQRPGIRQSRTDHAEHQLRRAHLAEARAIADVAHRNAERAAAQALLDVEDIEDAIEVATGERPVGDHLRTAPPALTNSYVFEPPGQIRKPAQTYLAGTTPPRWVAWLVAHYARPDLHVPQ